ncbi:MAG TPA: hypothetical protein VF587_10970 [Solirubrobacteraceae bacterium]
MRRSWWLAVFGACLLAAWTGALIGELRGDDPSPAPEPTSEQLPASTTTTPAAEEPRTQREAAPAPEPASWIDRDELRRRVRAVGDGDQVGVVVAPLRGGEARAGNLQVAEAWSTIKVPLVVAAYRLADEGGIARAEVDGLAARAIGNSDNAAAETLFAALGRARGGNVGAAGAIEDVLREGGDDRTAVNSRRTRPEFSIYGQTSWSLEAGVAFFRGLARQCVTPRAAALRTLSLMRGVAPDQRWGIGRAPFGSAAEVALKGGWGPGPDGRYVVRQFGVVRSGARGLVVGLMARPAGGTFEEGVRLVDALAKAVARSTDLAATATTRRCER